MLAILAIITLLFGCQCELGLDMSDLYSTATYQCFKSQGYTFAIIRAYHSYGGIDKNAVQGLTNAKNAGLSTSIYMFPCRGKDPVGQVKDMMAQIPQKLYDDIWIDVQTNPSSGCSWSDHDSKTNCQFLKKLTTQIKLQGGSPAIYASQYMWQNILGSKSACSQLSAFPLWYAHYDGHPSFSDYVQFGGWSNPYIKQYKGDSTVCGGAGVDLNYRK